MLMTGIDIIAIYGFSAGNKAEIVKSRAARVPERFRRTRGKGHVALSD